GRATLRLLGDGPATTGLADLRRGYHRVRLRVAPPELPAQNSPSFLHQIDRVSDLLFMDNQASEVQPISRRNLQRAVEVCGIHHRAIHSFRASKPELKLVTGNIPAVERKYLRLFDR
ncbi:hypothetical protein Prudu_695S000200, partial [Prunus dulcis]